MEMAPTGSFSPSSAGTVARVGDKVKVDKWTEFGEWTEFGVKYYHNPAKPNETAWEKPEDFDKQKNAGKPAAPTKPEAPQASEGGGAGGGVHTLSSPSPSFADEMSWVPTSPLPEEPVQVQPSQRQRSLPTANYLVGHEVENNEDSDANVNVDAPSGEEQGSGEEKEDGRRGEEETLQGDPGSTWDSTARQYANEGHSGIDRLGYSIYAEALAGLFNAGEHLPAAVGIYAPWGGGKSFLLDKLKKHLERPATPMCYSTWCCCLTGLFDMVAKSVIVVVIAAIGKALLRWWRACEKSCLSEQPEARLDEESAGGEQDASAGKEFIVVEFNAWEYAGSDVLWASVITKIFDTVERHPAFGRGAVRAARINKLLEDPSWNWCGLVTFYIVVTALGFIALLLLNWTGVVADISKSLGWAFATVVPGALTLLKLLLKMRSRGSLGTAQSVLQKAISRRESVGESYLGFMSDVREELEVVFEMIHTHNKKVERKRANKVWCGGSVFDASNKKKPRGQCKVYARLALTVIVDDLDRCPKKKVMEVLKATHLLLEHPKSPMVVFLAVDPQLIISAIEKSMDGVPNTMKALQYLDKIIHLPFFIPPISAKKRLNLLETLLNGTDNSCLKTLQRLKNYLKWAPGEEELKALMSQHEFHDLLGTTPMALELMCWLDHWRSMEPVNAPLPPPMVAFEECSGHLRSVGLKESRSACLNIIEELNKDINKVLSKCVQPVPGRPSKLPQPPLPIAQQPVVADDTNAAISAVPAAEFHRGVSVEENATFIDLFEIVQATPRKIKRVVNMYFLQRFLVQDTKWKEQDVKNAQELITWSILAEFWPFRLSCIAYAMIPDAQTTEETTIQSLYKSTGESPVSRWIESHRYGEDKIKDLYFSDDSEERFQAALQAGAQIPRTKVIGTLLHNSFNLNPAIMSVVEVKMAGNGIRHGGPREGVGSEDGYHPPDGYRPPTRGSGDSDWSVAKTATMARVPSEASMTARSQVSRALGRPDVDGILAALDWLGC